MHGYHELTAADVPVEGWRVLVKAPWSPDVLHGPGLHSAGLPRAEALGRPAVTRELAGRASARLLPTLGIVASRHTMLRGSALHSAAMSWPCRCRWGSMA